MRISRLPVRLGSALLLAGLSLGAKAETGYHLMWQPAVGEVHRYQIALKFDFGDGALAFNSDLQIRIIKVNPNGDYTAQSTTANATIRSGDNKKDLPPQTPVTETYGKTGLPTGDSLKDREPDPFADLLQHLTEFEYPLRVVRIGDEWTNHPVGPKTSFFGEPRVTYRLAELFADGPRHFARIHYTAYSEHDPQAATGTLILDRSNNHLYELDAAIPHFRPEGSSEEAAVSISVKETLPPTTKSGS